MKDFDNIEQLFSSTFKDDAVTPPARVKGNIDGKLFGAKRLRIIYASFLLLFGIVATSLFFYFQDNNESGKNNTALNQSESGKSNSNSNKVGANGNNTNKGSNNNTNIESNGLELVSSENEKEDALEKQDALLKQLTKEEKERKAQKAKIDKIKNELIKMGYTGYGDPERRDKYSYNGDGKDDKNKLDETSDSFSENSGDEKTDTDKVLESALVSSGSNGPPDPDEIAHTNGEGKVEATVQPEGEIEVEALALLPPYDFPYQKNSLEQKDIANAPPEEEKIKDPFIQFTTVSLYSGLTGGRNRFNAIGTPVLSTEYSMKESKGYSFSAEFGMKIKDLNSSIGFEYSQREEQYDINVSDILDSTFVGIEWIVTYPDPQDTTIVDSTMIDVYDVTSSNETGLVRLKSQAFTVPLYVYWNPIIPGPIQLRFGVGVNLSYIKTQEIESGGYGSIVNHNNFGMSFMLRPEIRYPFGRYSVSIYGRAGYNAITGTSWNSVKRSRFEGGVGLSLKYCF